MRELVPLVVCFCLIDVILAKNSKNQLHSPMDHRWKFSNHLFLLIVLVEKCTVSMRLEKAVDSICKTNLGWVNRQIHLLHDTLINSSNDIPACQKTTSVRLIYLQVLSDLGVYAQLPRQISLLRNVFSKKEKQVVRHSNR